MPGAMRDALRKHMPDAMHERTDELTNADPSKTESGSFVSNAHGISTKSLIALEPDDLHFIVTYDPERERSASRRDMVAVLEEIQALVNDGVIAAEETA